MLQLGPIAFLEPWLLSALLLLPLVWWLLRATPPAPRRVRFPPLLILLGLSTPERTPARTPWWLLLLRLLLAALLILALAGPVANPRAWLLDGRPLLLVLDDGWSAAPGWSARLASLRTLLRQAARDTLPVTLLRTAPTREGIRPLRLDPVALLAELEQLEPAPWPSDWNAAAAALDAIALEEPQIFWLTAPVVEDAARARSWRGFAEKLRRMGALTLFVDGRDGAPLRLRLADTGRDALRIELAAARPFAAETRRELLALGPGGEVLARVPARFAAGARTTTAEIRLPTPVRNRIARIELAGRRSAAEVLLQDERWRRRAVGLVGSLEAAESQPLLSELYYLRRALEPYADIREAGLRELLERRLSMIVLADVGRLSEGEVAAARAWIEKGGVLLRFAGPRLAAGGDDLLPVPLRTGDRALGGALSWSKPLPFAAFPDASPFAGISPDPEVRVYRQVLAQPGPDLAAATLARLADGTPIITGRRLGRGWLLLVHTTANTSWSSFALSRLFIDVLRRALTLAPGVGGEPRGMLRASRVLDGFGRLVAPPAELLPVDAQRLRTAPPGPDMPPGLWVPADAGEESDAAAVALDLQRAIPDPRPAPVENASAEVLPYLEKGELHLAPWLLLAAFVLALLDFAISLLLRGLAPRLTPAAQISLLLLAFALAQNARAQEDETRIAELAGETHLAYVRTGIPEIDARSEAGLRGLGLVLARRTSVEPADPVAVDPGRDPLALFPLLYWPVPPEHPPLAAGTLERLQRYLDNGGLVLFDTLDAGTTLPGLEGGPGQQRLAELLRGLDLPPLEPVPRDHALTRSFYLLQDFPGRFTGQPVWVDEAPAGLNDGVSRVIIGAHDWAGAWAVDEFGMPLYPVVPGGERQREMARRFGVNLVMYALTGNYKLDQVHVPALLERLGQ